MNQFCFANNPNNFANNHLNYIRILFYFFRVAVYLSPRTDIAAANYHTNITGI